MKRIYYLAPPGEEGRFDALFTELDIVVSVYTTDAITSLVAFVRRETSLSNQNYLLVNLTESNYSQEHILSAVQHLRRFSIARPIFIFPAPADAETEILVATLASFSAIGLADDDNLLSQLRDCLMGIVPYHHRVDASRKGVTAAARHIVAPITIPNGLDLTIAVAGIMPRIGCTTQVFAVYHYLKSLSFSPIILDTAHTSGLVDILRPMYTDQATQQGPIVNIRGIPFALERRPGYNAHLLDIGVLSASNVETFQAADIGILVGGAKPWELSYYVNVIPLLVSGPQRLAVCVSFATQADVDSISEVFAPNTAFPAPYHPDIWAAGSPAAYQAALLPLLKTVCGGA